MCFWKNRKTIRTEGSFVVLVYAVHNVAHHQLVIDNDNFLCDSKIVESFYILAALHSSSFQTNTLRMSILLKIIFLYVLITSMDYKYKYLALLSASNTASTIIKNATLLQYNLKVGPDCHPSDCTLLN